MVELIDTKIVKLSFKNNMYSDTDVHLDAKVKTKIDSTSEDEKNIIANTTIIITGENEDEELIKIRLSVEGLFKSDKPIILSKQLTKEVQTDLFPYLRSYISILSSVSGLPSITIPTFVND